MKEYNWNTNRSLQILQGIIDNNIYHNTYRAARYLNDPTIDLDYITEYSQSQFGYKFADTMDTDLFQSPKVNVIKSVIDTLVSKLANQKVRPYFTSVNGLYSTRKIVKAAQQYFDIIYDKQHVLQKIARAYRNACIFGIGFIFYNSFTHNIEVPGSWQVAILNTETGYDKPTKCLLEYKNFPINLLNPYDIKYTGKSEYVNFKLFYDTVAGECLILVNNQLARKEKYKAECIPIIPVYNTVPVFGTRTVSIVDELDGIQTNIDLINSKISTACQLTPGNTIFVDADSNLNNGNINNRTGSIFKVRTPPNKNKLPVDVVPPTPISPDYQKYLDAYIQKAYEMIGVSPMSATGVKSAGLDSGIALQTMSDIESDRFMVQLQGYTEAFVDLANMIIEINDKEILPKYPGLCDYTWEDVRKQKELFRVQFSAMSILSKDPQTKLQQIMQLSRIGLITTDKLTTYLDSPDLEDVYSNASAVKDAIDSIIDKTITGKEVEEIPDYVGYQPLLTEILAMENRLFAADDKEALEKLAQLKEKLLNLINETGMTDLSSNTTDTYDVEGEGMSAVGMSGGDMITKMAQSLTPQDNTPAESNLANPQLTNNMEIK